MSNFCPKKSFKLFQIMLRQNYYRASNNHTVSNNREASYNRTTSNISTASNNCTAISIYNIVKNSISFDLQSTTKQFYCFVNKRSRLLVCIELNAQYVSGMTHFDLTVLYEVENCERYMYRYLIMWSRVQCKI